jgi:putative FmdB family regulatory protein
MPIYEYACDACGKRSSALLASYAAPDPSCPHCGKKRLRRLISSFATVRSEDAGGDFDAGTSDGDDFGGGDDYGGGDDWGGDDDF